MSRLRPHLPFALASLVFLAAAGALGGAAYVRNGRHLVYTLDDAYIHLAMARSLATHGVFGITPHEFSSSSSSVVWTLLQALTFRVIPTMPDWAAAFWATCSGVFCLFAAGLLCRQFGLGRRAATATCFAVLLLAPLVPLVSTGLEHCLHAGQVLLLLVYVTRLIEAPSPRALLGACLTAAFAGGTRYESLFLVGPLALVLAIHHRRRAAALVLASACLVPVAYACYSVAHGSYPLPNSLMLKGRFHEVYDLPSLLRSIGGYALRHLPRNPVMASVCLVLLVVQWGGRNHRPLLAWLSLALGAAVFLHLQFARVGWFYRYEAYLVVSGTALACVTFFVRSGHGPSRPAPRSLSPRRWLVAALAILMALPLFGRAAQAAGEVVTASGNIYQQPYQTAHLVAQELGPEARVAVTDLGAVTFYADVRVLDLWGLGSIDVARLRRERRFTTETIAALLSAHRTDYVIVFPSSFQGTAALPRHLIEIGTWTISHNVVCGGETVGFYATSLDSAWRLRTAFNRYSAELPREVQVTRATVVGSASPAR
jgi:hypothetical protein